MDNNGTRDHLDSYVQDLLAFQSRLRGYILVALGDSANAAEVLQRTNLTLWKKAHEFRFGADFRPWAFAIARYEVLTFIRDHRRDRLVFSDDVAEMLLDTAAEELSIPEDRQLALRKCLEKLPKRSRDLIWSRYDKGDSIRQIAVDTNRSEDSIKSLMLRIRKSLERCIEATMRTDAM